MPTPPAPAASPAITVHVFMHGPNSKWVDADGVYGRPAQTPSAPFQREVMELVNRIDLQAVDLRYRFRVSKDGYVYVHLPADYGKLPVFLAAIAPLDARKIKIDWSAWYAGR
jgi:hypothetical protein